MQFPALDNIALQKRLDDIAAEQGSSALAD
jgi:hypothetical protein